MRSVERAVSVEDLRRQARARVPGVVFDFVDAGSEGGETLSDNRSAFQSVKFRPRAAVAVASRELRTTVLGDVLDFPVIVAPCGGARLLRSAGELALAGAASDLGTAYVIPHVAGHAMEEIRSRAPGPLWYQLYPYGGPEVVEATIERVERCGIGTLVITVDTATGANFEDSLRKGLDRVVRRRLAGFDPALSAVPAPAGLGPRLPDGRLPAGDAERPPGERAGAIARGPLRRENPGRAALHLVGHPPVAGPLQRIDRRKRHFDRGGRQEGGRGRCLRIVVSNHGGRMLDGSVATLRALSEVVEAVGDQAEILLDGGVRRGSDVVKALCLGARAVLVGRASMYGLAAGGQAGVSRALTIIHNDVSRCLAFLGCKSLAELHPSLLQLPLGWPPVAAVTAGARLRAADGHAAPRRPDAPIFDLVTASIAGKPREVGAPGAAAD